MFERVPLAPKKWDILLDRQVELKHITYVSRLTTTGPLAEKGIATTTSRKAIKRARPFLVASQKNVTTAASAERRNMNEALSQFASDTL